ncbi:MAG: HAMP domain-containing sensor histidine kinase [Woeseia sp.]
MPILSTSILKRFDGRRLELLLSLFFLALAVPTAVLIWQAYGQLKWEAYYQYRGMAEELTRRIDESLREHIGEAERRSFADYEFLVLAGDPSANFLQRSPLAAYPVETGPPGVIGYFQVDAEGDFRTPLLPPEGTEPASVGIDAAEYAQRLELADRLRAILRDNRLVSYRPGRLEYRRGGEAGANDDRPVPGGLAESAAAQLPEDSYSQRNFDDVGKYSPGPAAASATIEGNRDDSKAASQMTAPREQENVIGKVADLKLEPAYRDKFMRLEETAHPAAAAQSELRTKRTEQTALPAGVPGDDGLFAADADAGRLRISTFESELDPFEFGLLGSGHFVLFRKVWRDGQRFIQGILIAPDAFIEAAIRDRFEAAALAGMSELIVAYYDDVLRGPISQSAIDRGSREELEGTLLYRGHLSAPLDSLGLIFSIRHLPPGPGTRVLGWVTLLLAAVFLGGFYALHRLARGQLRLARQQQDFVSAVSHELKTPLTSIRMYGEMLKEGWANEDKRQQYYEYIHDESERLTRLISNVLQLASITRNGTKLAMRSVMVSDLMGSVEAKVSSQVERAGFEVVFDRDQRAEGAVVLVDEDCFLQIIINLVDNAAKFSAGAASRKIEIGSRLAGNTRVVFSVRDFGPGVPRNQMKKIFELFYRSENELTRETVGTGIGLAIVHQLTLAMKGSVDVVNQNPGAEFRISFPTGR